MSLLPLLPTGAGLLHDRLLVQAVARDAADAVRLTGHPGSGVVLSGHTSLDAARRLVTDRPGAVVLTDRRRYAGARRATGRDGVDLGWAEAQRELGLPGILTDSGYVGRGDAAALRAVLDGAARAGPDVTAVLPLHVAWLHDDLRLLCDEIADHGVGVALVLERSGDPLGVLKVLYGLVTVLALPVPVALLGGDVSALGALAFGAAWASVGVRGGRRHLSPASPASPAGGVPGPAGGRIGALVDPALSLVPVERIAARWALTPDDPGWACPCPVCRGRTIDRLLTAGRDEANAHTVDRLLARRDGLVSLPPGALRRQSWKAQCAAAAFQYQALALAGAGDEVPRHLAHWQRL
jgi:hypothetical protein